MLFDCGEDLYTLENSYKAPGVEEAVGSRSHPVVEEVHILEVWLMLAISKCKTDLESYG